ncbi:MAG TPA: hypothetical protein VFQ68_34185 [Streptosporangiaceae bacterium]|nr:hypothetical protein [Streptosporangiaceae bacterium]
MAQTVKWLPKPERHDYRAAEDYLSLLMPPKRAASLSRRLAAAREDITHRKAKDILRASQLPLLGEENKHVASDLRKAASGVALSPILLLRGDEAHPLVVADGYHRVCASYWIDENTDIPCVLVDP